jgi:hypothetical protein
MALYLALLGSGVGGSTPSWLLVDSKPKAYWIRCGLRCFVRENYVKNAHAKREEEPKEEDLTQN